MQSRHLLRNLVAADERESDAFPEIELRQLIYKSHRLIFTIRNDTVDIIHLRHVSRDLMVDLD